MTVASRASPIKITPAARSVLAAAAKSEVGCPRRLVALAADVY